MARVELDPKTRTRLDGVTEHVELCDEEGRTVGHFLPNEAYEDLVYLALAKEGPHSPEELRRRRHEAGGRSLSEIMRDLERPR